MGFSEVWNRTLVYFGIAEESYEDAEDSREERTSRQQARRPARGRSDFDDLDDDPAPAPRGTRGASQRRAAAPASSARTRPPSQHVAGVGVVPPRTFNDAQQIADQFKDAIPVILNLQGSDTDLSKRLIDFASGLTYALDGGMQRVADKVFLLTPRNVEVSAEERARMLERGGFFNQA